MVRAAALYICLVLLPALAACGDAQNAEPPVYNPPATKGGLMCIAQCGKSHSYCDWSCDLDYRACYADMQDKAQKQYEHYANHRLAHNAPVDLLPEDFEHPEKCDAAKKRCQGDCDRPYNACYSSCGGTVGPRDQCSFPCFD